MRRLLNILCLLGLLFLGLSIVSWIRSHYVWDRVGRQFYSTTDWTCRTIIIDTRPGQIRLQVARAVPRTAWLIDQFRRNSLRPSYYRYADPPAARNWTGPTVLNRMGLLLDGRTTPMPDRTSSSWTLVLPHWFLATGFLLVNLATLSLRRHYYPTRRPTRPGHCPHCNYDLRASQNRCPECGHPIPEKISDIPI